MGHNILFGERLCKFQDESLATFVIFEYKELLVLNYLYKCRITLPFYGLSNNKLKSLNSFFSMAPSYLLFLSLIQQVLTEIGQFQTLRVYM